MSKLKMTSSSLANSALGDYQTPFTFALLLCQLLKKQGMEPTHLFEPTAGKGAFVQAAIQTFPTLNHVYALEIQPEFCTIMESNKQSWIPQDHSLSPADIYIECGNFFECTWEKSISAWQSNANVLILGNPPWVCNSQQGKWQTINQPEKINYKKHKGIHAITGASNFDSAEAVLTALMQYTAFHTVWMGMLVKTQVIRNILKHAPKAHWKIHNAKAYHFNAKKIFSVHTDAAWFVCDLNAPTANYSCGHYELDNPETEINRFGWSPNKWVADIEAYQRVQQLDGYSPFPWWQGVKHDCTKVMVLKQTFDTSQHSSSRACNVQSDTMHFTNGFNESWLLEPDRIYPFLKSKGIQQPFPHTTEHYVIVPHNHPGEDTLPILTQYPNLHDYLKHYQAYLTKRKSKIYTHAPDYAIFGIGPYAFLPYKIGISGMYKRPFFSLLFPIRGKPILLDDTCYFLSFQNPEEAVLCWYALQAEKVTQFIHSLCFPSAKRPFTKELLMRISLDTILSEKNPETWWDKVVQLPEYIKKTITFSSFLEAYKKIEAHKISTTLFV